MFYSKLMSVRYDNKISERERAYKALKIVGHCVYCNTELREGFQNEEECGFFCHCCLEEYVSDNPITSTKEG